jgi:hypothetical protein
MCMCEVCMYIPNMAEPESDAQLGYVNMHVFIHVLMYTGMPRQANLGGTWTRKCDCTCMHACIAYIRIHTLIYTGKSKQAKRWKSLDAQLTDMLNEAKDNVKYLASLDHFIEPLYIGTIPQIKDSLPALFTNLKMMVSIARYYNNGEKMARLLRRIGNQIISGCRRCLTRKGRVLEQDSRELLDNIIACTAICNEFQEHCRQLRDRMVALAKGTKQVDFDPKVVRACFHCSEAWTRLRFRHHAVAMVIFSIHQHLRHE